MEQTDLHRSGSNEIVDPRSVNLDLQSDDPQSKIPACGEQSAAGRQNRRYNERLSALIGRGKAISVSAAVALHLVLALLLMHLYIRIPREARELVFNVDVSKMEVQKFSEKSADLLENDPTDIEAKLPGPKLSADVSSTPPEDAPNRIETPRFEPEGMPEIAARRKTVSGALGLPDLSLKGRSEFVNYLLKVRRIGLDVVFVFDSTSSMAGVLEEVKAKMSNMMNILYALVPGCRLGIVTYRDHTEGLEYVTRHHPLTSDKRKLMEFMQRIQASRGIPEDDFEEAVYDGLEAAMRNEWRKPARKVVVLIGDAPPHDYDEKSSYKLARDFRKKRKGVVCCIYVSTLTVGHIADPEHRLSRIEKVAAVNMLRDKYARTFGKIAHNGGGEFALIQNEKGIVRRLLALSFGSKWKGDIDEVYRQFGEDADDLGVEDDQ